VAFLILWVKFSWLLFGHSSHCHDEKVRTAMWPSAAVEPKLTPTYSFAI